MSKASDRLVEEWSEHSPSVNYADFVLAKIRARRDEICKTNQSKDHIFFALFDDGAEFGPDKEDRPGEILARWLEGEDTYNIATTKEGRVECERLLREAVIRRLGAEEVRDAGSW